jgi:tetratricopeptide (TPR) repeat protein
LVDEAIRRDDGYALAVFYKGVVLDLIGKPADAVPYFQSTIDECDDPDLIVRANFNLGVAYYHQYSHSWLQLAEHRLVRVIDTTDRDELRLLAESVLAQTHAMWMRPSKDQDPINKTTVKHITTHFDKCDSYVNSLRDKLGKKKTNGKKNKKRETIPRIIATYENAWGMANMYITDHVEKGVSQKQSRFEKAGKSLTTAEKLMPRDWANTCDLGSLELRRGVLAKETEHNEDSERHFKKAEHYLQLVNNKLRPGYGFALYELGKLYRVWKRWEEARMYQSRALRVAQRYRDVIDERVRKEIDRVEHQDDSYP